MWYMGGKCRQSKAIVEVLRPYITPDTVYVEPFCGGMWSAAQVAKELKPGIMILNDINRPLMLLWERCLNEGCDWLPIDMEQVEREYQHYRLTQDENDPLTAWYGIACSFGGKWFGGVARSSHNGNGMGFEPQRRSTNKKISALNTTTVELHIGSYNSIYIPDKSVVYLDPPYEGRTKAHHFDSFNYNEFWDYVRKLSKRCIVFTSCFDCPPDFETVYSWGDTVVRHHTGHGSDGTCEKLVQYIVYNRR